MNRFKLNRWIYVIVVAFIAICGGGISELGSPVGSIACAMLLAILTFPLGALGALSAMALIYPGIATVFEASFIAAPIYAVSGMVQWYLLFPRIFAAPKNLPSSL